MADASLTFDILARDRASTKMDRVRTAAKVLGAAVAVMAIKFGKDAVTAASDMEESLSKVGVVFGKNADSVLKWSQTSAKSFGLSQQASLESSATIGNLLLSMGKTPAAAAKMSTGIVGLAADMGSFNNVPTAEALAAIQSGLTGEIAPLRRFGVNLTDATLKAKALELGLYDGTGALDVSAKSTAAYQLLLEQTKTSQGDFARTSGGLANQQKILSATYQDVAAKAGKALLPALIAVAGAILTTTQFIGDHSTAFKIAAVATGALAVAIGGLVLASKAHALVLALQTEGTFAYAFAQKAQLVWAKLVTAAQWAWNVALTANPIGLVVIAIAALVAGLILAYKKSETFRAIVDGALRAVGAAFNWLADVGAKVIKWLTDGWQNFVGNLRAIKDAIGAILRALFDPIRNAWSAVRDWISDRWENFKDANRALGDAVGRVLGKLFDPIRDAWSAIRGWIGERWESFKSWVSGWAPNFSGMFDGIKTAFRSAINTVISWWNNLSFGIPGFDPPGPGPKFGGVTISTPNIPMLAGGGIVTTPTLAVVGDGGPEAVIPLSGRHAGLGGVNVNITVNALDPAGAATAVKQAMDEWVRRNGPRASWMTA